MTVSATRRAGAFSRRAFLRLDLTPARARDYWVRVHRAAMACRFEVVLPAEGAAHVAGAHAALDEVDRIEAVLSVFRESSEVNLVNRAAAEGPVQVSEELFALVRRSIALAGDTEGAFDVTVAPLSRCWGFLQRAARVPAAEEIDAARTAVSASGLEMDPDRRTIRFRVRGMELNFGAIGKGYALDRMARVLFDHGVTDALLSAGGSSVLAIGGGPGGWPIDLCSPRAARRVLARVRLRDAALGTSGAGEQFVQTDDGRFGHVLDPRTGWSAQGVLSASVVAGSAETADALSTAMFAGGVPLAGRYCASHDGVLALITPDDGTERMLTFGRARGAAAEDLSRCT
jgi:thiamine biosynthesis lipoprotein